MIFYLSGGMEYKTNLGTKWRDWITGELEIQRHNTINPVKLEMCEEEQDVTPVQHRLSSLRNEGKLDEVRKLVRKTLFRRDMFAIQMADALIVYYDESVQKGAGTISETWEAFREGCPVYLVTSFPLKKIPTWLIGETTQIFTSFEELLEYTKDHSYIIRDKMHSLQIRDEVLGGLY